MAESVDFVVVAGLSGAGRSTVANTLEDLGWFVIDNLPSSLLSAAADLLSRPGSVADRLALVAGSHESHEDLLRFLEELRGSSARVKVIFVDAATDVLLRRYAQARRRHPLSVESESVADAIERERRLLEPIRQEADLVSDCRLLPNPHWVQDLRPKTGLEQGVRNYVLSESATSEFLKRLCPLLEFLVPSYVDEGKAYLTIAFGCTGGRHRSVVIAEEISRILDESGHLLRTRHRDLERKE